MNVLLVGQADSIFFEHFTKAIRNIRPDIHFDVFSVDNVAGKYDLSSCDEIYINKWERSALKKIIGLRAIIYPFYTCISLRAFLKNRKKMYNVIHFKWLISGIVLYNLNKKTFFRKSIGTFWGSEFERQKILYSKRIYNYFLKRFLNRLDYLTYHSEEQLLELNRIVNINNKRLYYAIYGSTIYKEIEKLTQIESKTDSKKYWNIDSNKITISIGYSGKELHQHVRIIESLISDVKFKRQIDDYFFILPFTHGGSKEYYSKVIKLLDEGSAKYVLISEKLTDLDVARLRNATDIMLQLSISDGRSASIIEAFLAGAIVIAGKWLPYKIFHEKELYFYELDSIDYSLPQTLLYISKNIKIELEKCENNRLKMGYESWDKVIPNWIRIYENAISNFN